MSVQIRPATVADRQAILDLMRSGDTNRVNLQPDRFLIAETEANIDSVNPKANRKANRIIGIGQVKRHWDGTPELASLVVAEAYRGQGIGGTMVQALVDRHFARCAAEPLYLFCLSTLESYYQRFGFQRVERLQLPWPLRLMHFLGNGLGRLVTYVGSASFTVIAMKINGPLSKYPLIQTPMSPLDQETIPHG